MNKTFWDRTLPKIVSLSIAVIIVVCFLYDFLIRNGELTTLHVWLLLIVLVLVLSNMASRLKIFNFLDFNSKVNALREETRSELREIRNLISTTVTQSVQPVQHQTTLIDASSFKEAIEQLTKLKQEPIGLEVSDGIKDVKHLRQQFLRGADAIHLKASTVLQIARSFQIAILKHELPIASKGHTINVFTDEGLVEITEQILSNGVDALFPFVFEGEEKAYTEDKVNEIVKNLRLVKSFLELRSKIDKDEVPIPSQAEIDSLLGKVRDALGELRVAIILLGSSAIISSYEAGKRFQELRDFLQSEIKKTDKGAL